jgi:hypothetical protein
MLFGSASVSERYAISLPEIETGARLDPDIAAQPLVAMNSISGKWLELLKEIAPDVARIAVLRDPAIAASRGGLVAVRRRAALVQAICEGPQPGCVGWFRGCLHDAADHLAIGEH